MSGLGAPLRIAFAHAPRRRVAGGPKGITCLNSNVTVLRCPIAGNARFEVSVFKRPESDDRRQSCLSQSRRGHDGRRQKIGATSVIFKNRFDGNAGDGLFVWGKANPSVDESYIASDKFIGTVQCN